MVVKNHCLHVCKVSDRNACLVYPSHTVFLETAKFTTMKNKSKILSQSVYT